MTYKNHIIFLVAFSIILISNSEAQNLDSINNSDNQDFTNERYVTDIEGNIRMWVNIWGHVNKPGNYLVYNSTDIITLIAMAGGVKDGAKLKEIKIFREFPNEVGKQVYTFNMESFYKTGDRNLFLPILPNDAYYVPQKTSSFLISNVRILNTIMNVINLYYLSLIYRKQVK